MAASGGTKAVLAALIGNSAIALAKFAGFIITGASSMLAESIHSVADAGNQALLLWGGKAAAREADDEHQFGYGRERYFWAFVVALVLFLLGSGFALFEGVEKILHPHEVESVGVAVGILLFAIVAEGFTFRTAVKEAKPIKGDMGWWEFIRRTRSPELPVVLLEDLGAMIGLALALVALLTAQVTDDPVWDGIGTLSIGILLFAIAVTLIVEMRSLLIGEGAKPDEMKQIRQAIVAAPHVEKLIHLRTQHLGPDELLVGCKIEFNRGLSVAELAKAVDGVEAAVRAVVPHARPMYVEADLHREVEAQ
ncbi:MAG: cation transporter [Actinomycetia bacterium]|nr:cation transporter [Actinomycetes bacterium]MCP4087111.1 cation transporter [Actinomycetes bacterium]